MEVLSLTNVCMYIACGYIIKSQSITIRLSEHSLLIVLHVVYALSAIRLSEHSLLIISHVVYALSTIRLNEHSLLNILNVV